MNSRLRKLAVVGTAGLLAVTVAACAGDGGGPVEVATGDDLVPAAQDEGSVMFYSSVEETASRALADAFSDKYGIDAELVRLTSSDLAQRYSAEASAGTTTADMILISRTGFTGDAVDEGWLVPLEDAQLGEYPPAGLPEKFLFPDESTAAVAIQPAGIAYNTDLVADEDTPQTWEDLLEPQWKGKIALPDPASSASYIGEWYVIAEAIDQDFLARMAQQELTVYASGVPAAAAVAAGEESLSAMGLASHVAEPQSQGAPIEFVVPERTSGAEVVVGVSADGPHPNAGRLLAQFVLSEEGSRLLSDAANAISPYDTDGLPSQYVSPDLEVATDTPEAVLEPLLGK